MCHLRVWVEWSFLPPNECSIVVITTLVGQLIDWPCQRTLENKTGVFLEYLCRHTLQLFINFATKFVGHPAPSWKIVRSIEWIPSSQLCLVLLAGVLVWNQVSQFLLVHFLGLWWWVGSWWFFSTEGGLSAKGVLIDIVWVDLVHEGVFLGGDFIGDVSVDKVGFLVGEGGGFSWVKSMGTWVEKSMGKLMGFLKGMVAWMFLLLWKF